MRLISLSANVKGFREVHFNERGLSLIVGTHTEDSDSAGQLTTNGVGKSLLIFLVNFCLGSSKNDELEKVLPEWDFSLKFSLHGLTHVANRRCRDQQQVTLDDEEISLDAYTLWLGERLFALEEPPQFLTFRSLIGSFLRPTRAAYDTFNSLNRGERPYQKVLRASYLLGLDIGLVKKKYDSRIELNALRDLKKRFESDGIVRGYFVGDRDLDLDVADLTDEIRTLEESIAAFRVAEDYHEIEQAANRAQRDLQTVRNNAHTIRGSLAQIDESLGRKLELHPNDVAESYQEAQAALSESVVRTLAEVQGFHHDLLSKRMIRLTREKESLQRELDDLERQLRAGGRELDTQLGFLQTHRALDEYQALSASLSSKRADLDKLTSYKELLSEYSTRIEQLRIRMSQDTLEADQHLEAVAEQMLDASSLYRTITHALYEDLKSVLSITNNRGDNQTRFNIDAKIDSDASDGINEAKIFSYDMMLFLLRRNHSVGFLCHDSRLFADMDPRQRARALKLAHYCAVASDAQYIATLNDDQSDSLRQWMDDDHQFEALITEKIVLSLTDDSPEHKLLGCNVDLKYDEPEK